MKRVVITGVGIVSPLGNGIGKLSANPYPCFFDNLIAGKSGLRAYNLCPRGDVPIYAAGIVDMERGYAEQLLAEQCPRIRKYLNTCHRQTMMALVAGFYALADAKLTPGAVAPEHTGVFMGNEYQPMPAGQMAKLSGRAMASGTFQPGACLQAAYGLDKGDLSWPTITMPCRTVGEMARVLNIRGPFGSEGSACASSHVAFFRAVDSVRLGKCRVALAGGTDARLHDETLLGGYYGLKFCSTKGAIDPEQASRPFDRNRDGLVVSEGSGVMIVEDLDHALARGAHIYAEVAGTGAVIGGLSMTDPSVEAQTMAMTLALQEAGLAPSDIDWMKAHATGTPKGDPEEVAAIRKVFGVWADRLFVTSLKGALGHLIAASGAVELGAVLLAMAEGIILPTVNLTDIGPDCALGRHVIGEPLERRVKNVLLTNNAFGDCNTALVLRAPGVRQAA